MEGNKDGEMSKIEGGRDREMFDIENSQEKIRCVCV